MTYDDTKVCFDGIITGGSLKITGTTYWNPPNTGATNLTQFSAIGGGYRDQTGAYLSFKNIGLYRFTQIIVGGAPINVGAFSVNYNSSNISYPVTAGDFITGASVRLVRI
jgi:hypothetical protein